MLRTLPYIWLSLFGAQALAQTQAEEVRNLTPQPNSYNAEAYRPQQLQQVVQPAQPQITITSQQAQALTEDTLKQDVQTPGAIPLDEAMKRKPLKFIEVGDLPPPGETVDAEELVDPNNVDADVHFAPNQFQEVTFVGIHKLTGRSEELSGKLGDVLRIGNLEMVVYKCSSVMDQGERGFAALLEVTEFTTSGTEEKLFRGWLFSTSPSLSTIGHPLYDILLKNCSAAEKSSEALENMDESPAE